MVAICRWIVRNLGREVEVSAGGERRVDVDQVDLPGELEEERGEDVFLVALDQAVAPFSGLIAGEQVEH